MTDSSPPLGIIAGSGRLPFLVAEAVRATGRRVVVAAHENETDPALEAAVDELVWVKLGQLGRIRSAFEAAGVREVCMAGGVTKVRMFRDVRPDALTLKVMARVAVSRGDDRILRSVAQAFEDKDITVVAATDLAPGLLAEEGALGRHKPSRGQRQDITHGFSLLAELGRLDIGQALVLKDGVVLAVEAVEGTDACIRRGGELGGGEVVVVKGTKPGQDLRFDQPAVGPGTIDVLAEVGGGVLAVEAGRTLIIDRAELIARADAAGVAVVGVTPPPALP